jgi:hypothetical protein
VRRARVEHYSTLAEKWDFAGWENLPAAEKDPAELTGSSSTGGGQS